MIEMGVFFGRVLGTGVIFVTLLTGIPAVSAEDGVASKPRWMGEFFLSLSGEWRIDFDEREFVYTVGPMSEIRDGSDMSADQVRAAVAGSLTLGRSPTAPRQLIDEVLQSIPEEWRERVRQQEEEIHLGDNRAILFRLVGTTVPGVETADGPIDLPMGLAAALEKVPQPNGDYRVIMLTGTQALFDRYPNLIEEIVASFDDRTPPPFQLDRAFPYTDSAEAVSSARYSMPVLANDGFVAIAHQREGVVHVFDATGQIYDRWDLTADFRVDATRLQYLDLDFAVDGSLVVLAVYFDEPPEILVFERNGELRSRLSVDHLPTIGDSGVQPRLLRIAHDGHFVLVSTVGQGGPGPVVIDRLSTDGHLLSRRTPGLESGAKGLQLAVLPDDRVAVLKASNGAPNRAGRVVVIDADGAIIREWGPDRDRSGVKAGSAPKHFDWLIGADRAGTLFLRYRDTLLVYDQDARLISAFPLPVSGLSGSDVMASDDAGHILLAARPPQGLGLDLKKRSFMIFRNQGALEMPEISLARPGSSDVTVDSVSGSTVYEPQLLELAATGHLTVRTLRAFGTLPHGVDRLALSLRRNQIDLFAADIKQISRWRDEDGPGFGSEEQEILETLHRHMSDVLEAANQKRSVGR